MSVTSTVARETVANLLRGRSWVALTGAGISTDSGIPDYRGPTSVRATPDAVQRVRRLGRGAAALLGPLLSGLAADRPGRAQRRPPALADLEAAGLAGVITQNVDGLHAAAGSRRLINLHGDIATVVCLDCGRSLALGPNCRIGWPLQIRSSTSRRCWSMPSSGPTVTRWRRTGSSSAWSVVCRCGGRLKPDVVFFGESVPKARVEAAYALVEQRGCPGGAGLIADGDVGVAFRPPPGEAAAAGGDRQSRSRPGATTWPR